MDLKLISADRDLIKTCRGILSGLDRPDWTLSVSAQTDSTKDADLYVWDFTPGERVPVEVSYGSQHLFLVDQEDYQAFRAAVQDPQANILLSR